MNYYQTTYIILLKYSGCTRRCLEAHKSHDNTCWHVCLKNVLGAIIATLRKQPGGNLSSTYYRVVRCTACSQSVFNSVSAFTHQIISKVPFHECRGRVQSHSKCGHSRPQLFSKQPWSARKPEWRKSHTKMLAMGRVPWREMRTVAALTCNLTWTRKRKEPEGSG